MSKSDMYSFWRKKNFYENKHDCKAGRVIVISPMMDDYAKSAAKDLDIEVYGYADNVEVQLHRFCYLPDKQKRLMAELRFLRFHCESPSLKCMLNQRKISCRFILLLITLFGKNRSLSLLMFRIAGIGSSTKSEKIKRVKSWL